MLNRSIDVLSQSVQELKIGVPSDDSQQRLGETFTGGSAPLFLRPGRRCIWTLAAFGRSGEPITLLNPSVLYSIGTPHSVGHPGSKAASKPGPGSFHLTTVEM